MKRISETVVAEVCEEFVQSGMELTMTSVDDEGTHIELDLVFHDVECIDCVLPAEYLERLIATGLESRTGYRPKVHVRDPRLLPVLAGRPVASAGSPDGMIIVLDPTATGRGGDMNPGPDAGPLRGRTVGFRVDALWRSWDWVVDEWSRELDSVGSKVKTWKRWQGVPGADGAEAQAEYEAFLGSVDVVISGLGNCGSCTAWTVRDALTALSSGLPTAAVATDNFVPLAKILAEDGMHPGLRVLNLPYPLDTLPEVTVREIARRAFPQMLATIGAEATR